MRRRGFTLVEVVVALFLLQVALLALSAATIAAAREIAAVRRDARALAQANRRVALLRVSACGGGASGTLDVDGIRESWAVTGAGNSRQVVDSVVVTHARRVSRFAVTAWVYCP